MRTLLSIVPLVMLVGCSSGMKDARLHGTWRSNRDATVAAAFERDPRWTNASPEKVERFSDMFGHMTVTYSNGTLTTLYKGEESTLRYRVVASGDDYLVIRTEGSIMEDDRDIRIRFFDQDTAYWIDTGPLGFGLEERFDRVITEPDGAANGSQPIRSETNSTSSAAGSRR